MATGTHPFTTQDLDYLRHGDRPLGLRLFRPAGDGPFPIVIDLHGGAWTAGDLDECRTRDEALAASGLAVAAIDFRHAGDGYPSSLVYINYAIRWVKAHASELGGRHDLVGLSGQSSGGHLAMLAAMRPADPRYAAIPLPAGAPAVDAAVRAVAMSWPVINPLSRYRNVRRLQAGPNPPAWSNGLKERHDLYWGSEDSMAEGNPMLILERGERVATPPALWIQGRPDPVHDYRDPEAPIPGNEPERFAADYRKAGGEIELVYIEQAVRYSAASFDPIARFFHRAMPAGRSAEAAD